MKVNRARLKDLLREMTDIYSPSGKEEALLRFLCAFLSDHGYSFTRQPVSENRFNIIIIPPDRETDTVFVGHVDTVSAYDFDNYEFTEKRGIIKGLGTADMKGGCAAMIEAFIRYLEENGTAPSSALALVVGEEENSDGIRKLLLEHSFKIAVIGEPTDMKPCLGHYGYIEAELRLSGARRHASLSGRENNATYSMLKMLLSSISYLDTFGDRIRYNIRDLHSSESGFAVPEKCSAWLDVHVHPDVRIKKIVAELKKKCKGSLEGMGIKKSSLSVSAEDHPGYKLSGQWRGFHGIRKAMEKNGLPWSPALFESHSDAAYMRPENIKPVILGPGRLSSAHTKDESISFSQVALASRVYYDILSAFEG